jgi:hypothetical protein
MASTLTSEQVLTVAVTTQVFHLFPYSPAARSELIINAGAPEEINKELQNN